MNAKLFSWHSPAHPRMTFITMATPPQPRYLRHHRVWRDCRKVKRHEATAGTADDTKKMARVYASDVEAKGAAEAERKRAPRQAATLDLTLALGRADLYPEQSVTTSGFKPVIDMTTWLIAEVTHDLGEQGFSTHIKLCSF